MQHKETLIDNLKEDCIEIGLNVSRHACRFATSDRMVYNNSM